MRRDETAGRRGAASALRLRPTAAFPSRTFRPGRYTLRARSGNGMAVAAAATARAVAPMFASTPIVVSGDDLTNVSIMLAAAAGLSGTATLAGTQAGALPPLNQFRVMAPPSDFDGSGNGRRNWTTRTGVVHHRRPRAGRASHSGASAARLGRSGRPWSTAANRSISLSSCGPARKSPGVSLVFTDKITRDRWNRRRCERHAGHRVHGARVSQPMRRSGGRSRATS